MPIICLVRQKNYILQFHIGSILKAKIKYMAVSGNVLKKLGQVGRKNILFHFFILFSNGVKCKNVVLICHIYTLQIDISSHYA